MHVRICPECDEEYRPEIVTCVDCGATLEDRYENEDDEEREGPAGHESRDDRPAASKASPRPPGDYRYLLESETAQEVDAHAQRLGQAKIPYRVSYKSRRSCF